MHFILHKLDQLNQVINLPSGSTPLAIHFYSDGSGAIMYRGPDEQHYILFEFENLDELNRYLTINTFGGQCVGI